MSSRARSGRSRLVSVALPLLVGLIGPIGLVACGDAGDAVRADAVPAVREVVVLASADEVRALLADAPAGQTLVDVRTPEEFAAGHLEGARLVDFRAPTFLDEIGRLDRDARVIVYCRTGNRSAQAVEAMVQLGFTDIVELDGGVVAWEAAGLPFVTG